MSSLSGDYVHVIVQVTKDLVPVVFAETKLSLDGFDIGVPDMTYDQLLVFASRAGIKTELHRVNSPSEWAAQLSGSVVQLKYLLDVSK